MTTININGFMFKLKGLAQALVERNSQGKLHLDIKMDEIEVFDKNGESKEKLELAKFDAMFGGSILTATDPITKIARVFIPSQVKAVEVEMGRTTQPTYSLMLA